MTAFKAAVLTSSNSQSETVPRRYGREPSKGCQTCRRLKIKASLLPASNCLNHTLTDFTKCDEEHPTCSRCRIRGLACVYRDFSLVMFRDETVNTATRVRRRIETRRRDDGHDATSISILGEAKQLSTSIQQLAIHRFFHDFVLAAQSDSFNRCPNNGYLLRLPEMLRRCEPHSCFSLALSAAANANFATRHKSWDARWLSLMDYSRALNRLRADLECQHEHDVSGHTLAASHLLAMYELLVSRDLSQRTPFTTHVNGAVAFLESKETSHRGIYTAARGFQDVVVQMLINCLVEGTHPKPVTQCRVSGLKCDTPLSPLLIFMYRAAELCATWRDYCLARDDNGFKQLELEVHELHSKCELLDEEIETWMRDQLTDEAMSVMSNTKQNVPRPFQALFAHSGAPETLLVSIYFNQVYRYNLSRACRLSLLRRMAAITDTILCTTTSESVLAEYKRARIRIQLNMIRLVDEVLSTVFSTLTVRVHGKADPESITDVEGFRGLTLLWPLHTVGTSLRDMGEHCPSGAAKLEWVQTLFRYIRDDLGIQFANNFLQHNFPGQKVVPVHDDSLKS